MPSQLLRNPDVNKGAGTIAKPFASNGSHNKTVPFVTDSKKSGASVGFATAKPKSTKK